MIFEFGALQLDEPGRVLRLARQEVPLQPRAFDLLVYLIKNRGRVVPKEELLDAVWQGVTVTDNSLQRAISTLRMVLRKAGMEDAIRNFPRNGYRFCDEAALPSHASAAADVTSLALLASARLAVEDQRWDEAAVSYQTEDARARLEPEDLDHWALALQCLGRPGDAVQVLVRAIADHARDGNEDAAAASAATLSAIHLERGEAAVAAGWLSRATDLISGRPNSRAAGQVLYMQARLAASAGEPERALQLAESAYEVGRRQGDVRITALGLMYRGFFRLSLGDTREGLADQDHAAALALSHKMDPVTGGTLYCNVLWACRTFGDWARANQWTLSYQQFCTLSGMQLTGSCQLHRAEVLGVSGTLAEALAHITDALSRLSADAPWAIGDAHRVLGDLHAAMGDTEAAFAAYQACYSRGWCPEPGHAQLLLECDDADAAVASIERSLIGQGWWTLQRQGVLRAHLALISAHAGQFARAKALIEELTGQSNRWPMPSIRALTNEASALLAAARGEANEALQLLHLARQLWTSIDARLEAARLRIRIAKGLLELSDPRGAETEMSAALAAAEALGSEKLRQRCLTLQAQIKDELCRAECRPAVA